MALLFFRFGLSGKMSFSLLDLASSMATQTLTCVNSQIGQSKAKLSFFPMKLSVPQVPFLLAE